MMKQDLFSIDYCITTDTILCVKGANHMNRLKITIFIMMLAVCAMTTTVVAGNRTDGQRPDAPELAAYDVSEMIPISFPGD